MAFVWLIIHDIAAIAAAVYMITIDREWWAFAFFILAATAKVKTGRSSQTES